MEQAT